MVFPSIHLNEKQCSHFVTKIAFSPKIVKRASSFQDSTKKSTSNSLKLLFLQAHRKFASTVIFGPVILKFALISTPPALLTLSVSFMEGANMRSKTILPALSLHKAVRGESCTRRKMYEEKVVRGQSCTTHSESINSDLQRGLDRRLRYTQH